MKRVGDIDEVHFHNPRLSRVGVEVTTLERLRVRASLGSVQRVDFYLLLLIQSGEGRHMVDFVEHDLRPGAILLVRPGQIQQWRMNESLQGQLALVSSHALAPSISRAGLDMKLLALDEWPAVTFPSGELFMEATGDVLRLCNDIKRFKGSDVEGAIIRHALFAFLLRLARELRSANADMLPTREAEICRLFVRDLESSFHKRLSVVDYAERIGYSESTLSRACVATIGHTAKHAIDLRVALEAKRLLVHSQATVAQIGHQLGFTEATNFVKFFRRLAGTTPIAFRSGGVGDQPAIKPNRAA